MTKLDSAGRTTMTKLERAALFFSTAEVRECVKSLRAGIDDWRFGLKETHRTRPYPMGFYNGDRNLYYARGWGMHWPMWPWERWLVRRTATARQAGETRDGLR